MDSLASPTADRLIGGWYLIAGTAGFLTDRPKVDTIEVLATPVSDDRIQLSAVCSLNGRAFRMSQKVKISAARGVISYGLFPGSAAIMRTWRIGETRNGEVLRVTHEGSMLLGGGSLFYVRRGTAEATGRQLIERTRLELGLSERDLETMVWRREPPVTLTEAPRWSLRDRLGYGRPSDTRPRRTGRGDEVVG